MKKTVYFLILSLFLAVPPAFAQESLDYSAYQNAKPSPSSPQRIAMVFSKLAKKTPDFDSLARETEAYKNASDAEKGAVREQQVQEMRGIYDLLALQEPLLVEMQVRLSDYSASNKGFFVQSFKEETFFPARYAGRSYAIIPGEIMDKQWLQVTDEVVAKSIGEAALKNPSGTLSMILTIAPLSADGSSPAVLDGENYWLMSGEIQRMELYSADPPSLLWQSDASGAENAKKQELLKLRQ